MEPSFFVGCIGQRWEAFFCACQKKASSDSRKEKRLGACLAFLPVVNRAHADLNVGIPKLDYVLLHRRPRIRFAAAVWAVYATLDVRWVVRYASLGAPFKGSCRRSRLRGRAMSARFVDVQHTCDPTGRTRARPPPLKRGGKNAEMQSVTTPGSGGAFFWQAQKKASQL